MSSAAPSISSADLKQTYALALRIHHVKARTRVNPHAGRVSKVRALYCARVKCIEPQPFATEDLNLVESWIADVNVALVVYCQSGSTIHERERDVTLEAACCVEDLNAHVTCIKHEKLPTAHSHLARQSELARPITTTPLAELGDHASSVVHNDDHVSTHIADINSARCLINRNPCWTVEVRFASSQPPQVAKELT